MRNGFDLRIKKALSDLHYVIERFYNRGLITRSELEYQANELANFNARSFDEYSSIWEEFDKVLF